MFELVPPSPAGWIPGVLEDRRVIWGKLEHRPTRPAFWGDWKQIQHYRHEEVRSIRDPGALPDLLEPTAFIFHVGRCGSTLLSQMLVRISSNLVFPEPPLVSSMLLLDRNIEEREELLIGSVRYLGQKFTGVETHFFIKTIVPAMLDYALFRRTFPNTKSIFLFRDPAEVAHSALARGSTSWMRHREEGPSGRFGSPEISGMSAEEAAACAPEDFAARVIAHYYRLALQVADDGALLLVDHADLTRPEQLEAICEHVGLEKNGAAQMFEATKFHSKKPALEFDPHADPNRRDAVPANVRRACEGPAEDGYQQLRAAARRVR